MTVNPKRKVMFLPGGVTPAAIFYAALLKALGNELDPIVKDLELYADEQPPVDYSLQNEVEGIDRTADAAQARRFHLVGYSGGGACCLAYVAQHPERVISLALFEPAWIGSIPPEDQFTWDEFNRAMTLPPQEQMGAFMRAHMRPGLPPPQPPAGPPPPWMARRPAGLKALSHTFNTYRLDQNALRRMQGPVYYAFGGQSAAFFEHEGDVLGRLFSDFQVEQYADRNHFDPPQRSEPERFAKALLALWQRAESAQAPGRR